MTEKTIEFKQADAWVVSLESTYKSLPPLPKGGREFLVTITPWLALIGGVLSVVFGGLATLFSIVASPVVAVGGGVSTAVFLVVLALLSLLEGILLVLAFSKTKDKKMSGWKLLTYVTLLNVVYVIVAAVSSLVNGGMPIASLVWNIFWIAVEFYLLFQIKSYYK